MNEVTGGQRMSETAAARVQTYRQASKKKETVKAKKRLRYNPNEVSALLLRARTSQNASVVLTLAKSRFGSVKRSAASGQYSRREVSNAVSHARRMVQCAELKLRNLKEEELEEKNNHKSRQTNKLARRRERSSQQKQKTKRQAKQMYQEQLSEVQKEKRRLKEEEQKRRRHRNEEFGKISEANMKYLKGLCEGESGAVLELSMRVPLSQEQLERQLERQQDMQGEDAGPAGESQAAGAAAAETAGTNVDVEISSDMAGTVAETAAVSMDIVI